MSISRFIVVTGLAGLAFSTPSGPANAQPAPAAGGSAPPATVTLSIRPDQVVRTFDPRRLGGTNVALWNEPDHFKNPLLRDWIADLRPGYIRIPGGSWSNAVYWNGHGVRDAAGVVDPSRVGPDGYPAVDYSAYAPGFSVDSKTLKPSAGYHGNVDVKTLHDWVHGFPDTQAMPCLNAGSGRPIDAAEWVKWSDTSGYRTSIWEIGNELDGSWEPGHFLPRDGGTITAADYAQRYNAIASAMKAVNPAVRIGGCAFAEAMVREGGKNVDFVSIHTYPGTTTLGPKQNLAAVAGGVAREVEKVRGWIRAYQPDRADQIEVGYTEWNLSGGLNGSDLFSGLWHSLFLAEMARQGVDFATQWDVYTHSRGMKAGHGLIFTDGRTYSRKAGYHAMWLWNNYTGPRLLESIDDADDVHTLVTADDAAIYVQLINADEDLERTVRIDLGGFRAAATAEKVVLSSGEYLWDDRQSVPVWSRSLTPRAIDVGSPIVVSLPPFSVTHLRIPSADQPALSARVKPVDETGAKPVLQMMAPDEVYAGDSVVGLVLATAAGPEGMVPVSLPPAALSASRGVEIDRPQARLAESVGRFVFRATEPGTMTLTATSGEASVTRTLTVKPSEPRPTVFWDFGSVSATDREAFESEFALSADPSIRANKEVARIDLPAEGVVPSEKDHKRALLIVKRFPPAEKLNRANIRGVVFDLRTEGVSSDDPNASIAVVMQSPANYWMVLGRVPLAADTPWATHQVLTDNPQYINAMASSYNLWFVLESSKPVRGSLLLDRIGLMVR